MTTIPNKSKPVKHKCYSEYWEPFNCSDRSRLLKFWKQNKSNSYKNFNENRAWEIIKPLGGWQRQFFFGRRIFDFFHLEKWIAVEIDGKEHCKNCDIIRDSHLLLHYGLKTLRFRNDFDPKKLSVEVTYTPSIQRVDSSILRRRKRAIRILRVLFGRHFPKRKKGKKEKGFQKTILSSNSISKQKNKIILPPDNSTRNFVRKRPYELINYNEYPVSKNLTEEFFDRFDHYLEKE